MEITVKKVECWKGEIFVYITKLAPFLYVIDENHESTAYLIIGDEKACLIDTMNGYQNLKETVESLTDKPYVVVNTHGHPDHIMGNYWFDKVYLNSKDVEMANSFVNQPEVAKMFQQYSVKMPPYEDIKEGDVIDLGNRTLKVYELPGHTQGQIVLLCPEERLLFTGDAINHHLWAMLPDCKPLTEIVKEFDRLLFLEKEADYVLHGHSRGYDDISLMRAMRNGIQEIIDGKTKDDKEYKWFGGVDRIHLYNAVKGKKYQQEDHAIVYNENNIR